jgi:uncharacterized membrane protein
MRVLPALLALAYPVLAHVAAATGSPPLATLAVACLALAMMWPLRSRPVLFTLALLALAGALAGLHAARRTDLVLLFPPVLLTAFVGALFARSLAPGRVPLVERVVRAIDPEALALPGVPAHVRVVTAAWATLLCVLSVANLVLAALARPGGLLEAVGVVPPLAVSHAQWSWFANVFNYVLIGGLFVLEYAYRRRRWPQSRPDGGFGDFMLRMARLGPAFWRGT